MIIRTKDDRREFYRGIALHSDRQLRDWIAQLESGGKGTEMLSTFILKDFTIRALLGEQQSQVTLEWLADAFERILNHEDPRAVLSLPKRARNRPADPAAINLAIDVTCWIKLAMDLGYSEPEATELAAGSFSRDVRSIQRMRKKAAGWADSMTSDMNYWTEYFSVVRRRPLPSPKHLRRDTKS